MKTALVGFGLLLATYPLAAQNAADSTPSSPTAGSVPAQPALPAQVGKMVDPDGDCKFRFNGQSLTITVPGSARPHDLSAELDTMNAPRVLKPVNGDFTMQVTVQGVFAPGDDSTQAGRTGYTGAGLVFIADTKNYARLERATLHGSGGEPQDYVNFEVRLDGKPLQIGSTLERPITSKNPLHLRLQRKGNQLLGFVSEDGQKWDAMETKELPESWPAKAEVGVAAISTSRQPFEPTYTAMTLVSAPESAPASAAPDAK